VTQKETIQLLRKDRERLMDAISKHFGFGKEYSGNDYCYDEGDIWDWVEAVENQKD